MGYYAVVIKTKNDMKHQRFNLLFMSYFHYGSARGYIQNYSHAGNQADKRVSIWNSTDYYDKWKK